MKKILVMFFIFVLLGLAGFLYYSEGTLPVNKNDNSSKIFIIKKGETLNEIVNNLEREKLIRSRIIFYIVVKNLKIEKKIQAGDFRLSSSMNAYTLAENLTHGTLDIWITIIEGLRKEEIARVVSQNVPSISEIDFIQQANEGYLFPDTYLIPRQASTEAVLTIFSKNFNSKYSENMKLKAKNLNLSTHQVITLASLVEREARFEEDRTEVANILLRRLEEEMPLQIDATVQYAIGYQTKEKSWWKQNLTEEDMEIISSYNTYKNSGIPPNPICSPGLSSIQAVVNGTTNTPYKYYVSDKKGKLHFAKTLEEHNENINKYIQ